MNLIINKQIKLVSILFLLVFFSSFCYSLTINPIDYNIKNPKIENEYSTIITLINTKSIGQEIKIKLSNESNYLKEDITINKESIFLEPNERENIEVKLKIPKNITPQLHNVYINFNSHNNLISKFRIFFEIDGLQEKQLLLNDLNINVLNNKNPILFDLEIENKGNVIISPIIDVLLFKDDILIDNIGNKTSIQINPDEKLNISLIYDPVNLESGSYNVEAKLNYDNYSTKTISKNFILNSLNEESIDLKIVRGKNLNTEIEIENKNNEVSFYKIDYYIKNTDIKNSLEGQINNEKELIPLIIETENLSLGKYELIITINSGLKLENTKEKIIHIEVVKRFNILLIIFFIFLIISLFIYFYFKINEQNLNKIKKDLKNIKTNFINIENDMNKMNNDINNFVIKSNNYLDQTNLKNRFK